MTYRPSCDALINFAGRLANDPDGETFNWDEIQDALDTYRIEARYEKLTPLPTHSAGGVSYLEFAAGMPFWEDDATFHDSGFNALTPDTADWRNGRWTFAAQPAQPVTIRGWNHDPYQAAADLLEIRAAQLAEGYDFKTGPDSYERSQRHKQVMATAARIRAMSHRLKAEEAAATDWQMPDVGVGVYDVLCG